MTCNKRVKEEVDVFLSHLAIYLEQIFSVVIWEVFTHKYKKNMSTFAYCTTKNCTIEITANVPTSENSTIETNNSAKYLWWKSQKSNTLVSLSVAYLTALNSEGWCLQENTYDAWIFYTEWFQGAVSAGRHVVICLLGVIDLILHIWYLVQFMTATLRLVVILLST